MNRKLSLEQLVLKNKKGNSNARMIEREIFVFKHRAEIRKLIYGFGNNLKIRTFVDKVVRKEIEYNFTTGWWDIFKFIKRSYDKLFNQPENLQITSNFYVEYNLGVNEEKLEIEDEYCQVFGCGKKLRLFEKLRGQKCHKHSIPENLCVEYR